MIYSVMTVDEYDNGLCVSFDNEAEFEDYLAWAQAQDFTHIETSEPAPIYNGPVHCPDCFLTLEQAGQEHSCDEDKQ